MPDIGEIPWAVVANKLIGVAMGLIGTAVVFFVGRGFIRLLLHRGFRPMIEREQTANPARAARLLTLETVSESLLRYTLYFVVLGLLMFSVGLNPASLIATAGVAGVAIGFGAQKLVRDVVTGFLLLLEDQFSVGDLVTIGGNTGVVVETGMRITKLRDDAGRLIILSNGDIVQVINFSKGEYRIGVDLAVSSEADLEAIRDAVKEAGALLSGQDSTVTQPEVRGITAMSASSVTYRIEALAPPSDRTVAEGELRAALRKVLEGREIKLA